MKKYLLLVGCCLFFLVTNSLLAQENSNDSKKESSEMKVRLNEDGSHYLKFTVLGQIWFRFNESNPKTTVEGVPKDQTFDIGIRRLRFQFFGQLTDHAFFYVHIGADNFNYVSARKYTPFIQDALGEYKIKKNSEVLIVGGGLTILSGLSRFTQPQLGSIMSMDIPIFALPVYDQTDQAGRKLAAYLRGQVGKLDYRFILGQPFNITSSGSSLPPLSPSGNPITPNAEFSQKGSHLQYEGLLIWNFLETEPHTIAFMPGAYYGKKKVFNLEAGFITQQDATWSSPDGGTTADYHPLNMWSIASFLDIPINTQKETAINAYLGYFNTDYGHGYLRYNGPMNPADGPPASATYFSGSYGNALPMYGTGHVIYSQFGYLLPKNLLGKNGGALMPYVTIQDATYDRLDKQMIMFATGINWLMKGNTSKLTFDYQNRPTYTLSGNDLIRNSERKGQYLLQYQFFF
ncbi:MAG: hypothetical protein C5B52_15085 [Bacteroidetes bacterium]|nr:MAG: hypothetical protein C5B52_15085 [Bacteroidota bacterium]